MRSRLRETAATALAAVSALAGTASAQTWSRCNPLQSTQCPPDTALGMTITLDFTKGPVNSFASSGAPTYDPQTGASFRVSRSGDAPQLQSLFHLMFGRVEVTMRAAPGAGIVSSLVLESDDLDEIDLEWLGSSPDEVQSNYFGKGQTTTYNRGRFHRVEGTQDRWITYAVDWTAERILWTADGRLLRELRAADAERDQYPQTPMQVKFGAWAGGDPATNAPGTVQWARGPTDFAKGPFGMLVRGVVVADYSTGRQYRYGDTSGSWTSIEAVGGRVGGNGKPPAGGGGTGTTPSDPIPPAATTPQGVVPAPVPVGGIGKDGSPATATQTGWPWVASARPVGGTIPPGWHMTSDGKIMRNASPARAAPSVPLAACAATAVLLFVCFAGGRSSLSFYHPDGL